jgi:hypothetical protein
MLLPEDAKPTGKANMSATTTEERLAILEAEIASLKAILAGKRPGVTGRTRPDFLQNYTRLSANSPLFDEVAREITEERERERARATRGESDEAAGE